MTEPLFFDTDCLSAFLWINNQSLLAQLYPGRVIIPAQVYAELSIPSVPHLKQRIDVMISNGDARIETIQADTEEEQGGILASNNLRDISVYVSEFNLQHMTTGDILKEALDRGLITETTGNQLWQNMLQKRRRLGYSSFSDYLKTKSIEC